MANAFQRGQQAQQTTELRSIELDAGRRRERGINALGDQFGTGALAPNEFNTVTNAVGREEQRKINQRDTALDRVIDADTRQFNRANTIEDRIIASNTRNFERQNTIEDRANDEEDRAEKGKLEATEKLVGFFEAGIKNGQDPADIVTRATPALLALGVTEAEIGTLAQDIADNPNLLKEMRGALNSAKSSGTTRKAIGKPIEVRTADGKIAFMQTFSDGSTSLVEGLSSLAGEQAGERVGQGAERVLISKGGLDVKLSKVDQADMKAIRAELTDVNQERNFNETTIGAAKTVTRDIQTIQDLTAQAMTFGGDSMVSALGRAAAANVPGTDAFEVQQLLDSVKSNVGIDSLLKIKRAGSGLGQVPQSQLETLQSLLGNLTLSRNPALLARDLSEIEVTYADIISNMQTGIDVLDKRKDKLLDRRSVIEERRFGDESQEAQDQSLEDLLQQYAPIGADVVEPLTGLPPTPEAAGED